MNENEDMILQNSNRIYKQINNNHCKTALNK